MLGSNKNGYYNPDTEASNLMYLDSVINAYEVDTNLDEVVRDYESLFSFPFSFEDEVGTILSRYNGSLRIHTLKTPNSSIVKNPDRFLNVLKYLRSIYKADICHGLKTKPKRSYESNFIPIILRFEDGSEIGVFYFDTKKPLDYRKIQKVEKTLLQANLHRGIIIVNTKGIQAVNEMNRINVMYPSTNGPFMEIIRYSEITNFLDL